MEIKCPYGKGTDKWRNKEPEECFSNKIFFAELSDTGKLMLKRTHNYYYQELLDSLLYSSLNGQISLFGPKKGCQLNELILIGGSGRPKCFLNSNISILFASLQNCFQIE